MATIPLGEFAQARSVPQPGVSRVDLSGNEIAARALAQAGETAMAVGERGLRAEQQRIAQEQQEAEALARVKAANAAAGYQLQVQAAADDVADQLARGADYTQAETMYRERLQTIEQPTIEGLSPTAAESFRGSLSNAGDGGALRVAGYARTARRDEGQRQFDTLLDTLGKQAGAPGANVDQINAQAEQSLPLFRNFGLDGSATARKLQAFKDANWTNEATQRFNSVNDDPTALRGLLSDLTAAESGYAGKLDADKRNILAARVGARIDTLETKAARVGDKIDATAERTLALMDEQFATGVPATTGMWTAWSDVFSVASPERQQEFRARIVDEKEIQSFIRQPLEVQVQGIQQRQAKLYTEGGDKRAIANFNRLQNAVEANTKLLTETPLQFAQARLGESVAPFNPMALADPAQAAGVAATLSQRAEVVGTLRREYGPKVANHLLLPQEAQMLGDALKQATPRQKAEVFGGLRRAAGSDATYTALMGQLAPDQPVLALAGVLQLKNPKAAMLVVEGEALLNPPKESGVVTPKLPSTAEIDAGIDSAIGNAFRGRGGAYSTAQQAVRAAYAGAVAADGDVSGQLDNRRLKNTIRAVLGETVDFNGRGDVFLPYGMDEGTFESRLDGAWRGVRDSLPAGAPGDLDSYGLQQAGDGRYHVTAGRMFLQDAAGNPLVLDVTRAMPQLDDSQKRLPAGTRLDARRGL